jgi:DNA-binding transcriptional LysR family regulator
MDIHIIRSFTLLAEHLHFGKTADLLNLTQPALTKQIRRLERDLGASLFERGKHGTKLTTVGQLFLNEARSVVQAYDQLLDKGRLFASGQMGRLRIGFGFTTIELIPQVIVELRKKRPNLEISLKDMSSVEQMSGLRSGQLDLGFVRLPVKAEFNFLPILEERLVLIISETLSIPKHATLTDCQGSLLF